MAGSLRVYAESVKKALIGLGISGGTLGTAFFVYLALIGAITNYTYSGDQVCAGTIEDPCYAYINFTVTEKDIFIYPVDYDPWGRNTLFDFDPNVKSWKLERSWGSGWREVPLDKGCTGTWCGGKPEVAENGFAVAFRAFKTYQIRITAYKHNPEDRIKWSAFNGTIDPVWLPVGREKTPEVSYTPSSKKTCQDGRCSLEIYSGTQFVRQDNSWVTIDKARSLKGSGIKCVVQKGSVDDPDAVCDDWNLTSVTLANITSKTAGEVPIKSISKEGAEQLRTPLTFSKGGDKKSQVYSLSYGDELHIGNTSTTVILQSADSANLADSYLYEGAATTNYGTASTLRLSNTSSGDDYYSIIRFNTTLIPINANITEANLTLRINAEFLDAGESFIISPRIVYSNYSWNETNITYSIRPRGDNFSEHRGMNVTFTDTSHSAGSWQNFNMTMAIVNWFPIDRNNLSIYLEPNIRTGTPGISDYIVFDSKEASTAANRPYLSIVYDIIVEPERWCAQDSANKSTICGGLSGGNYSIGGNWFVDGLYDTANESIDEDYNTVGSPDYPNLAYLNVTYLKPINASNQSLWRVKTPQNVGTGGQNYSIPSRCWSSINLTFVFVLNGLETNASCMDGNTPVLILQDIAGSALYEEGMWWYSNQTKAKEERCTCPEGKDWGIYGDLACVSNAACSTGNLVFLTNGTFNVSAELNTTGVGPRNWKGFTIYKKEGVTIRQ